MLPAVYQIPIYHDCGNVVSDVVNDSVVDVVAESVVLDGCGGAISFFWWVTKSPRICSVGLAGDHTGLGSPYPPSSNSSSPILKLHATVSVV